MNHVRIIAAALAVVVAAGTGALPSGGGRARAATLTGLEIGPAYEVQRIDSPAPSASAQMGWLGITSAGDVTGDGADDVLVPETDGPGRIHVFSGADGAHLHTLELPDPSDAPGNDSQGSFIYPARLPDVASCPDGDANVDCPAISDIGDGAPEVVVGATGADIIRADGSRIVDIGRAYVFDGATGALLKRVQMPPAELESEALRSPKSFSFGRSVLSPFNPYDQSPAARIRIGDLDGGGKADFLVGNPTYFEDPSTNPSCTEGTCPGSGRVFVYRGEDVAQGGGGAILDSALYVIKNPMAQPGSDHERFGHATMAVGDVGQCNAVDAATNTCTTPSSTSFDGAPDFVISAHATDWPADFHDSGLVWLVDGATGSILRRYGHPDPQPGAQFGYHSGVMPTGLGNLGGSLQHPDFFVPAVAQRVDDAGQGRGWVLNGQFTGFSGTVALSQLDDPTPQPGANFGAPSTGLGDVAGDPDGEILVGQTGPLWPNDFKGISDVHIFDVSSEQPLLTIEDPDQQVGSGFGQGVANLGDVNDDGWVDFAVAAGFYSSSEALNRQGRLYIFRSAPAPPEEVERSVTLRLRKHLRAKGVVSAPEGFEQCEAGVPVTIKRGRAKVGQTVTDEDGRYSVRIKDRPGRYRAVATEVAIEDAVCLKAHSKRVRHRH